MLAAVGAGAINSLVGPGTLITFPTLVALGFMTRLTAVPVVELMTAPIHDLAQRWRT